MPEIRKRKGKSLGREEYSGKGEERGVSGRIVCVECMFHITISSSWCLYNIYIVPDITNFKVKLKKLRSLQYSSGTEYLPDMCKVLESTSNMHKKTPQSINKIKI